MNRLRPQRTTIGSTVSRNLRPKGKASEAASATGPTSRHWQARKCGRSVGVVAPTSTMKSRMIAVTGS
jgi:hypothetical protein